MGFFERVKSAVNKKQEGTPVVPPGRNDLCWCGSGKKYKKCHLFEEERKAADKACNLNCGPA